jgi:uncharacterized protein YndB with AHSA1/START domain
MPTKTTPRMSDEAVKAKTGKPWSEWFSILDQARARKLPHKEIVKILREDFGLGPWWQQMVAVTFEQQRGLRQKHEGPRGFQISVSRTLPVPLPLLYKAFANARARAAWLPEDGLIVRKATANKSLRITWKDGSTSLEIGFFEKGAGKSQVAVQHSKLPDARAVAKMKRYWADALERLRQYLIR